MLWRGGPHPMRWLRSGVVAGLLTWGFSAVVGAAPDPSLLLLFGGILVGVHAFLGYWTFHRQLSERHGMQELSDADYERIRRWREAAQTRQR
ncbi:MAG: hypothetical protein ISQ52_07605 [Synechococcus sp. BS307-5m-G38]|nr:hypothetical protein [Synechococcus sp. BS307-5m-G38]